MAKVARPRARQGRALGGQIRLPNGATREAEHPGPGAHFLRHTCGWDGGQAARRAGSSCSRACLSMGNRKGQEVISSRVRKQPRQRPWPASKVQSLMQGLGMGLGGSSMFHLPQHSLSGMAGKERPGHWGENAQGWGRKAPLGGPLGKSPWFSGRPMPQAPGRVPDEMR